MESLRYYIIGILVLGSLFINCGCADIDSIEIESKLSVDISLSASRSIKSNFNSGDAIGMWVVNQDGGEYDKEDYNNRILTYNDKWNLDKDIFLSSTEGKACAWFPYQDIKQPSINSLYTLTVETESQTDYLYSGWSNMISNRNANCSLNMRHALSCFSIKIKRGTYPDVGFISKVKIGSYNIATEATCNAATGTLNYKDNNLKSWIESKEENKAITNDGNTWNILFIPISRSETPVVTITMDGHDYSLSINPIIPEQGRRYSFTITANADSLELSSETAISEWIDNKADNNILH